MTIDDCAHDFPTLAASVLPEKMKELEAQMATPIAMSSFCDPNLRRHALLERHGHRKDFSGCYVLFDSAPVYVGISRNVFTRLRQHVTGRSHFDASLAYRMATHDVQHGWTRDAAMKDESFLRLFEEKRQYLRTLKAATVKIENPVELYVFEVYAALTFRTGKWNTFRTH